jgi:hypothetical protein
MRTVTPGSTDVSIELQAIKSADGTNETGISYNFSGIAMWYRRQSGAKTSISPVTLASLTTGHADGGLLHIGDGVFRFDLPDAAVAPGADTVTVGGSATGVIIPAMTIQLRGESIALRSSIAQAGGPSTCTLDAAASSGDNFYTGNVLAIVGGTGAGQARMITAYVGSTKVATVDRAWATNPASGSVFLVLPFGVKGMTPTEVAEAVLDASAASYNDSGTIGKKINDSGSSSVPPTAEENANAVLDATVETGATVRQSLRLHNAALTGKVSRSGATRNFRNIADTKTVISATVTTDSERTAVTRDVS